MINTCTNQNHQDRYRETCKVFVNRYQDGAPTHPNALVRLHQGASVGSILADLQAHKPVRLKIRVGTVQSMVQEHLVGRRLG